MSLIKVKALKVGYDGKAVADAIDFTVEKGDYLCVIGENGSGKTTLMKTLLGLNNKISGELIFGEGLKQNEIGYLPQQTVAQKDFPASVFEIALSGNAARTAFRPFYTMGEKQKAEKALIKMGISDLKKKSYKELSGGQQQRVLLARALTATEKMLLLDEPVNGLDSNASKELYSIINSLNKDGITVIMITHDIKNVLSFANKLLYIGDSIFFGSSEDYLLKKEEDGI